MNTPGSPRHFMSGHALPAAAVMPGIGMPGDRQARVAARRGFVALKLSFLQALEGTDSEWLRGQVRSAEEPVDLWLLRAPVFAALSGISDELRSRRQVLRRGLDSVFPDFDSTSQFVPL